MKVKTVPTLIRFDSGDRTGGTNSRPTFNVEPSLCVKTLQVRKIGMVCQAYQVRAGINDSFAIDEGTGYVTVTLTAGGGWSQIAFAGLLQILLNATVGLTGTYTVTYATFTNSISIASTVNFRIRTNGSAVEEAAGELLGYGSIAPVPLTPSIAATDMLLTNTAKGALIYSNALSPVGRLAVESTRESSLIATFPWEYDFGETLYHAPENPFELRYGDYGKPLRQIDFSVRYEDGGDMTELTSRWYIEFVADVVTGVDQASTTY